MQIRRPFDAHVHLRDAAMLAAVVPETARTCAGALVMPNLVPPVTTRAAARAYRSRIVAALPSGARFTPQLTAYLTDGIDPDEVIAGYEAGDWVAAKLYPAHATTNSAHGVSSVQAIEPVLRAMAQAGMPLCVHGEVTDPHVDIFDREAMFLQTVLAPLLERLGELRVVVEHATTEAAVHFVREAGDGVAMSITAHHLWWNRNALFAGGLRPHSYCLPVLKRESDRQALLEAATCGDDNVFFGTDSAPHLVERKESSCGCAGVFSAPTALEAVAHVFSEQGALETLEAFTSLRAPAFYGIACSEELIALEQTDWTAPETVDSADGPVHVFLGGQSLPWRVRA